MTEPNKSLQDEIERLKAENEALKTSKKKAITLKVSAKGGVSVYGLGRFPITLYHDQWINLLSIADKLKEFLAANREVLPSKTPPTV